MYFFSMCKRSFALEQILVNLREIDAEIKMKQITAFHIVHFYILEYEGEMTHLLHGLYIIFKYCYFVYCELTSFKPFI